MGRWNFGLERDLAERAEDVPEMAAALEADYRAARQAERTGDTFTRLAYR